MLGFQNEITYAQPNHFEVDYEFSYHASHDETGSTMQMLSLHPVAERGGDWVHRQGRTSAGVRATWRPWT